MSVIFSLNNYSLSCGISSKMRDAVILQSNRISNSAIFCTASFRTSSLGVYMMPPIMYTWIAGRLAVPIPVLCLYPKLTRQSVNGSCLTGSVIHNGCLVHTLDVARVMHFNNNFEAFQDKVGSLMGRSRPKCDSSMQYLATKLQIFSQIRTHIESRSSALYF